jgi:malonate transporter
MITILTNALAPIFAGLLIGYLAGLWRRMDNQNVQTLTSFVMDFAIPCSLFLAVATTPLHDLREQSVPAIVLTIMYVILYATGFVWARLKEHLNAADSSVLALTVGFPNAAAVGLPLLATVFGSRSTVTVATAVSIGSITISSLTLLILEASGERSSDDSRSPRIAFSLIRSISNPVVCGPMLGLAFSWSGLSLPAFISQSLATIGSAAAGAALVLTGLVVSAQALTIRASTLIALILKCLLQPIVALAVARLLRLPIEQVRYVTLIGATPCGFFGVVFGKRFGSTPELASTTLIASYLVSPATLAAWIAVVGHLT